jgi:hypothetical protein
MSTFRVVKGEVVERLREMPDASFHGVLCDPPYGLTANKKGSTGFMGLGWDACVPGVEVWQEVLRVLSPGSHLLAFGGTRTHHRLMCAIEDAGFELTDCCMWLHGGGFPKAKSCLKPAWEPIILARKRGVILPLNIDACRIESGPVRKNTCGGRGYGRDVEIEHGTGTTMHAIGRWPANVILDEESAAALDEQSGITTSGGGPSGRLGGNGIYGNFALSKRAHEGGLGDSGGASRFFYCAKASKSDRGVDNSHPTVKPVDLCTYLAKLILPAGDGRKLIVPFSGSGSEMRGGIRAGWDEVVGIEIDPDYQATASKRLGNEAPLFNCEAPVHEL